MQFTYSDIFDTKGIEYLIVIFFFLLLIPFWQLLNRPLKARKVLHAGVSGLHAAMLRIPRGLFFNKNHTWSSLEASGLARVGMDDLLLHLTGGVSVDYLVDRGARVRRGDLIARVMQGDKHLEIRSPLTGKVAGLNPSLVDDPNLLQDPYASWLCKIDPEHWKQESNAALLASEAMQWAEEELTRFKDFLAERLAGEPSEVALQEGGVLVDEPLSHMAQELWVDFQQHFLEF